VHTHAPDHRPLSECQHNRDDAVSGPEILVPAPSASRVTDLRQVEGEQVVTHRDIVTKKLLQGEKEREGDKKGGREGERERGTEKG